MKKLTIVTLLSIALAWCSVGLRLCKDRGVDFDMGATIQEPARTSLEGLLIFPLWRKLDLRVALISFDILEDRNTFGLNFRPGITPVVGIPLSQRFMLLAVPDIKFAYDRDPFIIAELGAGIGYSLSEKVRLEGDFCFMQGVMAFDTDVSTQFTILQGGGVMLSYRW